ncbi:hypothetical protein AMAG_11500 [Allomyces macrogynus ATCC 38327]|uniref:Uncharacterized protein n=1 Tax=Allomyces macrogynus (strain ATCC 38327) TaxID=578462 RepID=A0A0L0SV13_ALLM3|nr:hypothetical protein AMAG_11500 [Allomyces macrogynus ATCC 38327]|eukprot:KNE66357.1 hypothetical protein AMAG_11500 [Allomyces macrogynus ATCC 38327]
MSSLSTSLLAPPSLGVSPAIAVSPVSSPMAASPVHSPSDLPAADAMQLDVHDDDMDAVMNDGAGADDNEDALLAVMDDDFDDSDVEMGVTTPVARAEHPPVVQLLATVSSESPVVQMPTPVSPLSAASVLADPIPPLMVESHVTETVAATVDSADLAMTEHVSTDLTAEVPSPLSSLEADDVVEVSAPTDAITASLVSSQAPDSCIDSAAHADDKFDLSHSYDHHDDDELDFSKLPSSDGDVDEGHQDGEEGEEEDELEAAALLKYDDHTYTLFTDEGTTAGTALFATTDLFYDEPINDLIRQLKAHFGLAQAEVALRFDHLEGLTIHEETDIAHSNHLVNFANLLRTLAPDSDTPLTMTLQVLGESAQWKLDQLVRRAQALLEEEEDEYLQDDDEHVPFEHDEKHLDNDDDFALDAPGETNSQPQQHQTEIVHEADGAQGAQQPPAASSESHLTNQTKAQISPAHTPTTTTTNPPPRTSSTTLLPASPTSVSPVPVGDATVAYPTLTVDAVVANGHRPQVTSAADAMQPHVHEDDDGLVAYEEDASADDHTSSGRAAPLSPTADHVLPARYGASPTVSPQHSVFSVAAATSASAPMSPRMGAAAVVVPTRPGLVASPSLVGAALGAVAAATTICGALFAPVQADGAETEEVASETVGDAAPAAVPSVMEAPLHGSRKRGLELDAGAALSPKKPRLDVAADVQDQ